MVAKIFVWNGKLLSWTEVTRRNFRKSVAFQTLWLRLLFADGGRNVWSIWKFEVPIYKQFILSYWYSFIFTGFKHLLKTTHRDVRFRDLDYASKIIDNNGQLMESTCLKVLVESLDARRPTLRSEFRTISLICFLEFRSFSFSRDVGQWSRGDKKRRRTRSRMQMTTPAGVYRGKGGQRGDRWLNHNNTPGKYRRWTLGRRREAGLLFKILSETRALVSLRWSFDK